VKMDKQGRMPIPAAVRRREARLFVLEGSEGGELRLKPIKEIRSTDLFDPIETHKLRKARL